MKKYIIYTALMAAMVLTGCKGHNEVEEPVEGQEITLSFSMASEVQLPDNAAAAPSRIPGDPGKDDFIAPTHLYFALWVETGGRFYMKTCHIDNAAWAAVGNGIYQHDGTYKLKLPSKELTNATFHVFAFASTVELTTTTSFEGTYTEGETITETSVELATLKTLTYSIPSSVTTGTTQEVQEKKRDFFRSMYSTALSETDHNQMATSPTIRLRHTASRLDINWECETATTGLPDARTSPLTANSTWTIALASDIMPDAFSLFTPGSNGTGSAGWSETITIDEGMRYNGRFVTYLPMPSTPTFTVTSSDDDLDESSPAKTLALTAGSNTNYATWLRALWTIK